MTSTSSFADFFTLDELTQAYDEFVARKTDFLTGEVRVPAGWDRVSLAEFESQLSLHLGAIKRKVLSGRYTFRPFVYVEVEKTTGGTRQIAMSTIRDRIVQGQLLKALYPHVESTLSPCCHAYRRNRSVHTAVQYIHRRVSMGAKWVLESDFRSFFDNLQHDRLSSLVAELGLDPRLEKLVFRYLRTPQMPKSGARHPLPPSSRVGVPQGGVLSGLLANLYLAKFDESASSAGYDMVRYADDFLVLSGTRQEARSARNFVEGLAQELGLSLHPRKTCINKVRDGFDFVGFRLRGSQVRVRQANVDRFRARVDEVIRLHTPTGSATRAKKLRKRKRLIRHVNAKIRGVEVDGVPRSWIAFFRIANDAVQIRTLNRWVWQRLSDWNRRVLGMHLAYSELRSMGLESLTGEYHRVRRILPTAFLEP